VIVRDALKLMESRDGQERPVPFDLVILKMDLSRKTGGDFTELNHLEKVGQSHIHRANEIISVRRFGSTEKPRAVHMRLIFGIRPLGSKDFLEVN
jgi:hypothetical protein